MDKSKLFLYRYGPSNGGKLLARCLGIRVLKQEGSKFTPSPDKAIINWGSGRELPVDTTNVTIINKPEAVANATHKRKFFELCREAGDVQIPRFTTRRAEANDILRDNGVVFARTVLQGSGGEGIVEVQVGGNGLEDFPEGTLFVEYIKKKHEFRIHVGDGKIIDYQQKKKRREVDLEDINWRIRSHANGFVFARTDVRVPKVVEQQALKAMEATGLDFGAVDVIYNGYRRQAYVLEINTAPGIEGSTVLSYRNYFQDKLGLDLWPMDRYDVVDMAAQHGIRID